MEPVSTTSLPPASGQGAHSAVTLQTLQQQYPHLKLSAQSFSSENAIRAYAMKQSGNYNVAIDPRAIARMGEDEALSAKVHETLGLVKETHDWVEGKIRQSGATLIAQGTIIDQNGDVSMWGVSQTTVEGPGLFETSKKSREDLAARIQARKQEEAARAAKLEEKKKAEADDSLAISLTVEKEEQTHPAGQRIDTQA